MGIPADQEPPLLDYAKPPEQASAPAQLAAIRSLRILGAACVVFGFTCFGMLLFSGGLTADYFEPGLSFGVMFLLLGVGGCVHVVCSFKMDKESLVAALIALMLAAVQESVIVFSMCGDVLYGAMHGGGRELAALVLVRAVPALWIANVLVDLVRFLKPSEQ